MAIIIQINLIYLNDIMIKKYNKIKHDIVLEEYLIREKNFKNRQLIAKFRTSNHCLQIETGRYINIPHQHPCLL